MDNLDETGKKNNDDLKVATDDWDPASKYQAAQETHEEAVASKDQTAPEEQEEASASKNHNELANDDKRERREGFTVDTNEIHENNQQLEASADLR